MPDYVRYHKITYLEDDLRGDIQISYLSKEEKKEINEDINKLLDEQENLIVASNEFEKELRKVIKTSNSHF